MINNSILHNIKKSALKPNIGKLETTIAKLCRSQDKAQLPGKPDKIKYGADRVPISNRFSYFSRKLAQFTTRSP